MASATLPQDHQPDLPDPRHADRREHRPAPDTGVSFRVTLRDGTDDVVEGADAYQQEHSMTTFFRTEGRRTVDCWSVRVASFRTDQILVVRRLEQPVPTGPALRVV